MGLHLFGDGVHLTMTPVYQAPIWIPVIAVFVFMFVMNEIGTGWASRGTPMSPNAPGP